MSADKMPDQLGPDHMKAGHLKADALRQRFAGLADVADRGVLTYAADVRHRGDRRTRRRRRQVAVLGAGVVAVAVAVILGAVSLAVQPRGNAPVVAASPGLSAPASPAGPSGSPPATISQSPSSGSVSLGSAAPSGSATPGAACLPEDLTTRPSYGSEGAHSIAADYVVVRSAGHRACVLPALVLDAYSVQEKKRVRLTAAPGTAYTLRPGGPAAEFGTSHVSDSGFYDPGSPECANPRTYEDIQVVLGTRRYALPDFRISVPCGSLTLTGWYAFDGNLPNPH